MSGRLKRVRQDFGKHPAQSDWNRNSNALNSGNLGKSWKGVEQFRTEFESNIHGDYQTRRWLVDRLDRRNFGRELSGKTRDELIASLKETLPEALEFNRQDALDLAGSNYQELAIALWNAENWFGIFDEARLRTFAWGRVRQFRVITKFQINLRTKFAKIWEFQK